MNSKKFVQLITGEKVEFLRFTKAKRHFYGVLNNETKLIHVNRIK